MAGAPTPATRPLRSLLLLLAGLGLPILGIAAYLVQISRKQLIAPWYVPALAAIGLILVIMALRERRTAWRLAGVVAVVLVLGAEAALWHAMRLPAYEGPIAVGKPFPAFKTVRADGTPFTERDLFGDRKSVLVFFRGRW